MGRVIRRDKAPADDDDTAAEEVVTQGQYVNAVVTVPADGLASFYMAVAAWWERYDDQTRGRVIR